jgi:hypothetical protein
VDVRVDGGFEGVEGAAGLDSRAGFVDVEEGSQEPLLELGVEDRDADAFGGELVGVCW